MLDSDDWMDAQALDALMRLLKELRRRQLQTDMIITNYVYEKPSENKRHVISYRNVLPKGRLLSWDEVGHFLPQQNLLMHSIIYRRGILNECRLELPAHTFYVDNLFAYQPLSCVDSLIYLDVDLYHYFIGRSDQSVNEQIMISRIDQQLRVTRHMIDCQDLDALKGQKKLRSYMLHYLSMMMAISDIFLLLDGSAAAKQKENELWAYLKAHTSAGVYRSIRYGFGGVTNLKIPKGDKLVLGGYRLAQKIFKFN